VNGPDLPSQAPGSKALPPCEIQLQNPGRDGSVAARRLRPWLAAVVAELAPMAGSLGVRFISDQEMRRLNRTWRHKDQPTDVLSFPGELHGVPAEPIVPAAYSAHAGSAASPFLEEHHLGDIAISMPTARRQARRQDHGIERELRTLLLHGLLHCLGYDHETDGGAMRRLESRLRARWIDHG